jgi:signal transduction histidine kinase
MPQLPIEQFKREQAEIVETGALNKLLTTCDGDSPLASIYTNAAGEKETLTSVTPVTASLGCWVVITAYPTAAVAGSSNGQPYWMKAEFRTAAAIYAAMALLIIAVVYGMSRRRRKLETALGDTERTNRRLERTLADANAASDSKNRLLEVLGHELRKPLTAILDLAETMSREEFGPLGSRHYKKQLTGIVENTSQQLSIIDELLDGSAIEARAIELHEGVVDLLPIIDGCRDEAMKRAAETGVKFVAALPKQLPRLIADGRLLRQMVLGLLAGSLRWTPNGGRITLGAEHLRNGELAVWVADTAGGIDGANRETAPAPADSLAEVVDLPDRDAGSGLPTVKSLIEAHGGRLELKEQAGAGTVATLLFPSERVRALVGAPSPLRVAG